MQWQTLASTPAPSFVGYLFEILQLGDVYVHMKTNGSEAFYGKHVSRKNKFHLFTHRKQQQQNEVNAFNSFSCKIICKFLDAALRNHLIWFIAGCMALRNLVWAVASLMRLIR